MDGQSLLAVGQLVGLVATGLGIINVSQGAFGKSSNLALRRATVALVTAAIFALVSQVQFTFAPSPHQPSGAFGIVIPPDYGLPPEWHWVIGFVLQFFGSLCLSSEGATDFYHDRSHIPQYAALEGIFLAVVSAIYLVIRHYSMVAVITFDLGVVTGSALLFLHPDALPRLPRGGLIFIGILLTLFGVAAQAALLIAALLNIKIT